jgi:hypothetical protein
MDNITVNNITETHILNNPTPRTWHQKETIHTANGIAVVNGRIKYAVRARWYMGRSSQASVVYCAVSLSNDDLHTHGHGSAGGGGYDKISASLGEALRSADVELSEPIDGTGRSREAIEAITRYLYPDATAIEAIGAP